jgi:cytidylate kinase
MIVIVSGAPGSGKSTMAKAIAQRFGLRHFSTGDFMREIASERGLTLLGLIEKAEKDPSIDKEVDALTERLGSEQDNFVMDSRIAWHFIPGALKIFLDVPLEEGAKRIFLEKRQDEKYNLSLEQTVENIKKREASEARRYKKYYGIRYDDKKNFDAVVDTNGKGIEEVKREVFAVVKEYLKKGEKTKK